MYEHYEGGREARPYYNRRDNGEQQLGGVDFPEFKALWPGPRRASVHLRDGMWSTSRGTKTLLKSWSTHHQFIYACSKERVKYTQEEVRILSTWLVRQCALWPVAAAAAGRPLAKWPSSPPPPQPRHNPPPSARLKVMNMVILVIAQLAPDRLATARGGAGQASRKGNSLS